MRLITDQMFKAAPETPVDIRYRHIVTALLHPLPDASDRNRHCRKPEIVQMNSKSAALRLSDLPDVRLAAESAFQREGLPALDRVAHPGEQQPPCFEIR